MEFKYRFVPVVLLAVAAGWLSALATPSPRVQAKGPAWTMADMIHALKPMRHSWAGRMPLTMYCYPLQDNWKAILELSKNGKLRQYITQLARRGYALPIQLWQDQPLQEAAAVAQGRILQQCHVPVYLLLTQNPGGEAAIWPKKSMWLPVDKNQKVGWKRSWPIFPLADSRDPAEAVRKILKPLKKAGIKLAGMITDYEGLPGPYNGAWIAERRPAARKFYRDQSVFKNWWSFATYCSDENIRLQRQIFRDPLQQLFPDAFWAGFGVSISSRAHPYVDSNGAAAPPRASHPGDVTMPVLYADNSLLARYTNSDWVIDQRMANDMYWYYMLRSFDSNNINAVPGSISIAYVSSVVEDKPQPRFQWFMSRSLYRELLRQVWLRGVQGMVLFNPPYRSHLKLVFNCMEDTREVFDEMLTFRKFLQNGKPMTFSLPPLHDRGPFWSGLMLPGQALVRVVSLDKRTESITIPTFPGKSITLSAVPQGRYYLIRQNPSAPNGQSVRVVKTFSDLQGQR